MIKTIRVMIIPNNKQSTRLFQFAGTARFAYNWALNDGELRKRFTNFKKEPENIWLYDISNNVCKKAIKDAVDAYKRFFKGLSNFPRYKSRKRSRPSFYIDTSKIKFTKTHVKLENIALSKRKTRKTANWFRLAEHERVPLDTKYFNPRVSFDGLNWFLTLGIEIEETQPKELNSQGIGIDLGIKDLAVCSSGHVYKNINKKGRMRRLKKKLRRLQRIVSRKYKFNKKGESYRKTRNVIKSERELLKVYRRLTNIRTNYIHQVTSEIVKREPSFAVLENLNVTGMMKNKNLAKAVQEQKLAEFYRILNYKCEWNGIKFITADSFYASSKICSLCGHKKGELKIILQNISL